MLALHVTDSEFSLSIANCVYCRQQLASTELKLSPSTAGCKQLPPTSQPPKLQVQAIYPL